MEFPAPGEVDRVRPGVSSSYDPIMADLTFSSSDEDMEGRLSSYGFVDSVGVIWFVKLYKRMGWLCKVRVSANMKTKRARGEGTRSHDMGHLCYFVPLAPPTVHSQLLEVVCDLFSI